MNIPTPTLLMNIPTPTLEVLYHAREFTALLTWYHEEQEMECASVTTTAGILGEDMQLRAVQTVIEEFVRWCNENL